MPDWIPSLVVPIIVALLGRREVRRAVLSAIALGRHARAIAQRVAREARGAGLDPDRIADELERQVDALCDRLGIDEKQRRALITETAEALGELGQVLLVDELDKLGRAAKVAQSRLDELAKKHPKIFGVPRGR